MKIFNLALILLLIHFTLLAQVIKVDCCSDIGSKATIIINNNLTTLSTSTPSTTTSNVCNFKLNSSANTSAGVYKVTGSDTTLIRTLFSGVHFDAGCYTVNWDGLLDDGARASNGSYLIKILSNNVQYKWGLIGNSSKSFLNNEQYNAMTSFYDIALSNNYIYYATGYAERDNQTTKAPLNDLGRRIKVQESINSLSAIKVATDADNVYWGGYSNNGHKFIFAVKQADDSQVPLPNGSAETMDYGGITYNSCIGVSTSDIWGLAVNPTFIFYSRKIDGVVTAYNKLTGATTVNSIPFAENIAVTSDGKAWVVKGKGDYLNQAIVTANRLSGTGFNSDGSTNQRAQDNDLTTSDGGNTGHDYVGVDLGSQKPVAGVAIVPLTGHADRLVGSVVQGSNTSATSGFTDLYSIQSAPAENQYTSIIFPSTSPYRYIRVYTPNSFANINELAVFLSDPDAALAKQYSIGNDGTFTATGISVPADDNSTIDISPVTGNLAVLRSSTNQIKIYNSSGSLIDTIGQAGGYNITNGPAVTYDKFSFYSFSAVKFGKDGSLWVSDNGNKRLLHLTASGSYIEKVSTIGINYNCAVDQAKPIRVFAENLEFTVDYTKDLSAANNGAWELANNWQFVTSGATEYQPFEQVTTFPNGKTYAKTHNFLFELRPNVGAVFLNIIDAGKNIEKDGSLWTRNTGNPNNIVKQPVTGYDGNTNAPIWGAPQLVVDATNTPIPFSYNNNTLGASTNPRRYFFYQPNSLSIGSPHLGSIKISGNVTDWLTSPSVNTTRYTGPYPPNGYFDATGHSENCRANIIGSNVFWHVNDELGRFTEVCYTNHYNEDGLFIGQFGNDNVKAANIGDNSFLAGNSFTTHAFQIPNSNDIGYITGDESKHAAVQFVRISNLSSIHEDIVSITLSGAIPALGAPATNLMANLPYASDDASAIASNTTKWALNSRSGATAFQTSTGTFSKDSIDVYCKTYNGNMTVSRFLNSSTLNKWKLTGRLLIQGNSDGNNYSNYFDLLDVNGKRIARLYASNNYYGIYLNGNVFISGGLTRARLFNDISYAYNGTSIIVNYLGQTVTITSPDESGALLSSPGKLRVLQSSTGGDQVIDVYNLKFVPEP